MYLHYIFLTFCIFIVTLCGGGMHKSEKYTRTGRRVVADPLAGDNADDHRLFVNDSFANITSDSEPIKCQSEPDLDKRIQTSPIIFTGKVRWLFGKVRVNDETIRGPGGRIGEVIVKELLKGPLNFPDSELLVEGFESPLLCNSQMKKKSQGIFFAYPISGKHVGLSHSPMHLTRRILRRIRFLLDPELKDSPGHRKIDLRKRKPKKRRFG